MRISESAPSVAPAFKPVAVEPGTVSDDTRACQNVTPRAEQVSFCRIWEDFPDAAFGLAKQNREKTGVFCTKQPLCAMFYGRFLLFGAVRPRNLAAGTRKSGPRKRNSRPRNFFFPAPFFPDGGPEALFPAIWNFFTGKSPMSICRHKPRPADVPRQSLRGNSRARDKKKSCTPVCRHLGFRTFRETAFFAPAAAPCPVQVNLRGLQMTKCQLPGKIAKCQIRHSDRQGSMKSFPVIFYCSFFY